MIAQEIEVRAAPSAWFAGRTEPTAQTVLRRYQRARRVLPAVAGGVCTASRAEMGDGPSPRGEQREAHPQRLPVLLFCCLHRQTSNGRDIGRKETRHGKLIRLAKLLVHRIL